MYDGEKNFLGVRKYISKHIVWLNKVLINLKRVKCTILSVKFYFYKDKIIIVSYRCNGKG